MRKKREFLNPDLTPLIDIVFLLLIFFMATSVFKKDELKLSLTLPTSEKGEKTSKEVKVITIHVTKDAVALNKKTMSIDEMKEFLAKIMDKDIPIEMRVDKEVTYEKLIKILDLLKEKGFSNLDLITQKKKLAL